MTIVRDYNMTRGMWTCQLVGCVRIKRWYGRWILITETKCSYLSNDIQLERKFKWHAVGICMKLSYTHVFCKPINLLAQDCGIV